MSEMEKLFYLYGVLPGDAPEPPGELRGLDDRPVVLVHAGGLAAAVSEVSAAEYADEELNARLGDLAWVGERGLAHERVLDWFVERGPVVPLSLFSLHRGEQRVRERLEDEADRLSTLLEQLRGRREWGVRLWRHDEQAGERLEELSPSLQALTREIEQASPGRRFLLTKKREELRGDELRRVSARVAHLVHAALEERAERAVALPIPAGAPPSERTLLLHAAYLVPEEGFAAFQRRLGELAGEFQPVGYEFEFTGPWPPYHFTGSDAR